MNLEYNSQRKKLIIPEYGRNVQKLLAYAKTIEDKEQRQLFVEMVVELMEQMQAGSKPSKELTDKLWNHAFIIGNYELDVEAPDDVEIVPSTARQHPPKLPYPNRESRYRHYGYNVQQLIDKAVGIEDEKKRELMAVAIASYMKLAYRTWNKEHYVNDESIKQDLKSMSKGKLDLDDSIQLDFLNTNVRRKKKGSGPRSRSKGSNRSRRRR